MKSSIASIAANAELTFSSRSQTPGHLSYVLVSVNVSEEAV